LKKVKLSYNDVEEYKEFFKL